MRQLEVEQFALNKVILYKQKFVGERSMKESSNMNYKNDKQVEKFEKINTFIKDVQVGDIWKEVECEYEIVNNCAIEKGGDYLVFVKEETIIPDYVKTIGQRAFDFREIKSIAFPKSVEVIEA